MDKNIGRLAWFATASSTLLLALLVTSVPSASAEGYAVTVNPSIVQEGGSVTISLSVTGAQPGTRYEFIVAVLDSSTTLHTSTAAHNTTASQSSFVVSKIYPNDFPVPASTQYVGSYQIFVDQTRPVAVPNVGSASFNARMSDKTSYERTQTVQVRASGYNSGEQVATDIRVGTFSVAGYPTTQVADSQGMVGFTWQISTNATIGTYRLSINGTTTQKSTPDLENFDVRVATLTLTELTTGKNLYSRGEKVTVALTAIYPGGTSVDSGNTTVSIRRPSGAVFSLAAKFNFTSGRFETLVILNKTDEVGYWMVSVLQNGMDDGFGNTGPSVARQVTITVQTLQLQVNVNIDGADLSRGDVFAIRAMVSYPDGTSVTSGAAIATILYGGDPLRDISLQYYSNEAYWEGTYVVRSDDPAGDWVVRVAVSDDASPVNTGVASAPVTITEPWLTSSLFLYIPLVGAGVGALALFLFMSRRRVTRKQLKVDLQVIESEVKKIQEKDFFKSISDQLNEQGLDKEEKEEK